MDKCLLDILTDECSLVRKIDTLNDNIKLFSNRRIELLMQLTSDEDEDEVGYIAHLQTDIDRMNTEKFELQENLAGARYELANYIKYTILKGE